MWVRYQHFFSSICLLLLLLATGVFAVEKIDCVNYSGEPDSRCMYLRVLSSKGFGLFVVPDGEDVVLSNAIPNEDFYVYAPLADNDSVEVFQQVSGSRVPVGHMDMVNSGESRYISLGIKGLYPYSNIVVGTSATSTDEPNIFRVYNFYAPALKYYVDGTEVTDLSKLQLEVGDTLRVDVQAVVTMGPSTNTLDTTVTEKFFVSATGASADLDFRKLSGKSLDEVGGVPYVDLKNGEGSFLVLAPRAVTDGSTFTLSGYKDTKDPKHFFVVGPFPGDLQFVNPDMPILEKAAIYDVDGDGIGDSISTWFGGKMDSVEVKKFFYAWPTDKKFNEYGGDVKNLGKGFGLPDVDVDLQSEDATGAVKAYVCSSVGNRCDTLKTALLDSIGAVIQMATLVKGNSTTDTLVLRFNKSLDTAWTEGDGLMVNGKSIDVEAIRKVENVWTFVVESGVVSVGDRIKIETTCEKVLTAADGVSTKKNNQEVVIKNAGRVYMDGENNGFYDRDGDGRMDSASVGFDMPVTEDDLKNMELIFYWLDNDGDVIEIKPSPRDLTISDDGLVVGFALDPQKFNVMEMLTSIDSSRVSRKSTQKKYGYVAMTNKMTVDGKDTTEEFLFDMNDYMAPVIAENFLNPESFQYMAPDKFTVTFSEAIDYEKFSMTDDCLAFYVDGAWMHYSLTSAEWSDGGRKVTFFMEAGEDLAERMNPADSVRFDNFTSGLVDMNGNLVSEKSPAVMVEGDPRVIMKTTSFADLNRAQELSDKVKPFSIDHVADKLDKDDASSLGVLMDIGFSTIMKNDSGVTALDLENSGLTWELNVYTNLGVYVGGASGKISCDDSFFKGNCFENPDKLYVRWNMRSDDGRRVGVGVYLAKFKVKVFGAKDEFLIERVFRWGVGASRK